MTSAPPQRPDRFWAERTRADTRRYWDAHPIAVDSVEHEPGTPESFQALYTRFRAGFDDVSFQFLEQCRGRQVLEMGCGIAMSGRSLVESGAHYTAVDYSRRSLKLAREHFRQNGLRSRFVHADGTQLPFPDGSFEVVFSDGVVHHIPDVDARVSGAGARGSTGRHRAGDGLQPRVVPFRADERHRVPLDLDDAARPRDERACSSPATEASGPLRHRASARLRSPASAPASTDTSSAGEGNYNPHSYFLTERELRTIFSDLEQPSFRRKDLRGFPIPWLRGLVERRFGFFLSLTGRKPGSAA